MENEQKYEQTNEQKNELKKNQLTFIAQKKTRNALNYHPIVIFSAHLNGKLN